LGDRLKGMREGADSCGMKERKARKESERRIVIG
jgi:hypothetical protein